ncbi:MAG: VanZ family protein [Bacteroidales bacterium]|nr:VanZ family protein [Bacteroidales bacterium]
MELNKIIKRGNSNDIELPFFKKANQALLAALLWMVIILLLTGLPGNSFPKVSKWMDVFQPDKLIHIAMFFPFAWFWQSYLALINTPKKRAVLIVIFSGIVYASLTEVLQYYIFIGRNANIPDAIADIIGVIFGVIAFSIIFKNASKK